jgi:predicted DsbA family dithiol-disulfide isomerase
MHDQLFAHFTALEAVDLVRYSTTLGLDLLRSQECLDSGRYANDIRKDMLEGQNAGVRGTPTFFIGVSEGEETKLRILKVSRGAKPYTEFKRAFDSLLTSER